MDEISSLLSIRRDASHLYDKADVEVLRAQVLSRKAQCGRQRLRFGSRQFISGLIDHLRDPLAPGGELDKQKELLLKYIHIEDECVGESEDMSRTELKFSAKSWPSS